MKIIHIVECAGGVEWYLEMLVPRLADRGIRQTVVCSHFVKTDCGGRHALQGCL